MGPYDPKTRSRKFELQCKKCGAVTLMNSTEIHQLMPADFNAKEGDQLMQPTNMPKQACCFTLSWEDVYDTIRPDDINHGRRRNDKTTTDFIRDNWDEIVDKYTDALQGDGRWQNDLSVVIDAVRRAGN